jgi:hypothetical protein
MIEIDQHHLAAHHRPYVYLALVPACCFLEWTLILVLKRHLSESSLYRALDISLYFAVVCAVVLVAIPIRFRRSASLVKLVAVAIFCGLILALVTFLGYMTVGFG